MGFAKQKKNRALSPTQRPVIWDSNPFPIIIPARIPSVPRGLVWLPSEGADVSGSVKGAISAHGGIQHIPELLGVRVDLLEVHLPLPYSTLDRVQGSKKKQGCVGRSLTCGVFGCEPASCAIQCIHSDIPVFFVCITIMRKTDRYHVVETKTTM